MKRRVAAIAAVVGAVLVGYAFLSAPSDEERIAEALTRLETVLSFESPPNVLTRTAALNASFEELLVPEAQLQISERGISATTRREIAALASRATSAFQRFEVDFSDVTTEVSDGSARTSLSVTVEAQRGSELRRDERRAQLGFVERDGDWLLASVDVSPRQ